MWLANAKQLARYVLLLGRAGSGRETRNIHTHSRALSCPCVCALSLALVASLTEGFYTQLAAPSKPSPVTEASEVKTKVIGVPAAPDTGSGTVLPDRASPGVKVT